MKANIDYNDFPKRFVHCLNEKCTRGEECLRRQMALEAPEERRSFTVVNPKHIHSENGENCTQFLSVEPKLFAKGIKKLFDKIPHKEALLLKQQILNYLGHNTYYRCYREERMLSPQEQEYIQQLFLQQNIKEPPQYEELVPYYQLD